MQRDFVLIGIAIAGCLLVESNTTAGPIGYGSFSGTIVNFDSLAGSPILGAGEVLANQFSGLGVA